jgi:hypothetical protein
MKGTENFKLVIEKHLQERAQSDPLFVETLKKPEKNIEDCITYILNTVQESGCSGFADDEIFNMAVHYYDEDNIEVGTKQNCSVVVNHTIDLSQEEIKAAKEKAIQEVINEQKEKMLKKKAPKPVDQKSEVKTLEPSLFD